MNVVNDPFDGREPDEAQRESIRVLRERAKGFRDALNAAVLAASREKALALTNLEQALMWAERAAVPPTRPSRPPPTPSTSPSADAP